MAQMFWVVGMVVSVCVLLVGEGMRIVSRVEVHSDPYCTRREREGGGGELGAPALSSHMDRS